MLGTLFLGLSLYLSLPAIAAETAKSLADEQQVPADDQCVEYLKGMQKKMLKHLNEQQQRLTVKLNCFGAMRDLDSCKQSKQQALNEIATLQQHRQNRAGVESLFINSGYSLRAGGLGLGSDEKGGLTVVSGAISNGMDQRVDGLSQQEQIRFWRKHDSELGGYLAQKWWPQQAQQFPRWRHCLQTEGERIILEPNRMEYQYAIERSADKHLLFPRFVSAYKCEGGDKECRQNHQACLQLMEFWSSAPYGLDFQRERKRTAAMHDSDLKADLPPWLYNVSEAVDEGGNKENQIRHAYEKLFSQTNKLKNWIASLQDYQLKNLLAFENQFPDKTIKSCKHFERTGVSSLFCKDHGLQLSGSRLVDECIAGFFMPANAALNIFKDMQNDREFVVGVKSKEDWQEKHDENAREAVKSTMSAVPVGAVQGVIGAAGVKVLGKVAGKVYDKTLRLLPYKKLVSAELYVNRQFQELVTYLENRGIERYRIQEALRHAQLQCQ